MEKLQGRKILYDLPLDFLEWCAEGLIGSGLGVSRLDFYNFSVGVVYSGGGSYEILVAGGNIVSVSGAYGSTSGGGPGFDSGSVLFECNG